MNKNLFRIIFNKRRGQRMAVAETSSSQGKGSRGEAVASGFLTIVFSAELALGVLSFAVLCALGAVLWALPTPNAYAQVVAYRSAPSSQQPTILQTANGVPQVNIQTPSAAGVSRNVYSQFDVQSNGVILNNSRTNVQTQQGGWVQGNPWLATGSARVILNEVSSSNPSYLNGYVEVAGQRAEVVIANPSGISVNGGGFINTSKATLTTGTPIVNNSSLDGYRVQGGNISINGNGLDLSTTDYSAILARAVQVNAGIWANELKVVTGANQIDAASLAANTTPVTTPIAGAGGVPSVALDVAQIGGMYAGKIHLIGTEQGLGVRTAGTVGSTGGDLVLQNNGWLTNTGALQASANLQVTTQGNTTNSGTLYARNNQTLSATGTVANSGIVAAQGNATLTTGSLNNDAGYIGSTGALTVTSANISNQGGLIRGAATVSVNAGAVINSNTSASNQGIEGQDVNIVTAKLNNNTGAIRANNDVSITSTGKVDNTLGLISAGNALTLQDTQTQSNRTLAIANKEGTLIADITITVAANSLGGDGAVLSKNDLSVTLNTDFSNSSQVIANHNASLNTTGNVTNSGQLQAGNTLNLTANNIGNTATGEISAHTTQVNASSTLTNRGLIDGTDTQINANTVNNIGTGRIYGDHLSIAAVNLTNDTETIAGVTKAGTIAARDRLDLGISGILTNREHALIYSVRDIAIGGALNTNHQATGKASTLNNNSATIEAGGNLSLSSATVNNTNDHFTYEIRVATTEFDVREDINSGLYRVFTRTTYLPYQTASDPAQILSGGDMSLNSSNITNHASHILAGGVSNIDPSTLVNTDVMATKSIRDIGTTYTLVHVPQSGTCGKYVQINCVRAHDEWQTAPYDSTAESTVSVAQVTAFSNSGAQVGIRTQAAVSDSSIGVVSPITLPASSLYKNNPSPTSAYLIETDARFTNNKLWLGSDYMSNALSLDPSVTQKRLGDGFYEQKLIREQVAELTGRRFLADYTSDDQEYKALMDSGITYAKQYNLRPGIALTAQQIAQLTSDIVWLIEQTVSLPDGSSQKVLVPQVYVKVQPGDLDGSGALLGGKEVNIKLSGDLTNSGTIFGRKVVSLTAENVNNLGGRIGGNDVSVAARQDLNNIGGSISAVNSLIAIAERDLNVQTTTQTTNTQTGIANNSRTGVDRVAGLYVSGANGTLVASAGRNIDIVAGVVSNAGTGNTDLSAGNNFTFSTVKTGEQNSIVWNSDNHLNYGNTQTVGSSISGNGKVSLKAVNDLTATAANVQATQALTATAGGTVNVLAGENTTNLDEAHKTSSGGGITGSTTLVTHDQSLDQTAITSSFSGKQVTVLGKNVISEGAQFNGENLTHVEGSDKTLFYAVQEVHQSQSSRQETSSFLGITTSKSDTQDSTLKTQALGSKLTSDQALQIGVGSVTDVQGAVLNAPAVNFVRSAGADTSKPGELILGGSTSTTQTSHTEKTETAGVYQELSGQGETKQTLNQTQINGKVTIGAGINTTVVIPDGDIKTQVQALSQQPGLAYIGELSKDPRINWQQVKLAYDKWDYSAEGLTPAGAALLAIAIAAYTGNMGADLLGGTAGTAGTATIPATQATLMGSTVLGAAANAGFAALAASAGVSFVNNGGDLGKTFKDMGSSQNVKGMLTAMATAGVLTKLGSTTTATGQTGPNAQAISTTQAVNDFNTNLTRNVTNNLASAVVSSAINGKPLSEETLSTALTSAFITSGMAQAANSIGDARVNGALNDYTQAMAHALAGCVGGAATAGGGGCAPGALGAVVGELTAKYASESGMTQAQALSLAKTLSAAAGVLAAGGNGSNVAAVNIAAQTGANAAENNYVSHSPFKNVRSAVNAENARLTQECGANCTQEDFKRIDQMMVKLEVAGNLAAISQKSQLSTEQAVQFGEAMAALLPVYGTPIALYQAITGQSLSGQDLSTAERVLNAAAGALPLGSAAYKVVMNAAQDMSKMASGIGAIQGFKSAEEVNGLMNNFNKAPAWKEGTQIAEATMQPGTKVQMVVDKAAYDAIKDGNMSAIGNWATFDNIPNQAFARNNLAITNEFKKDVGYVVELEIVKPVNAQIGVVGSQGTAAGGANQMNFLFARGEGAQYFKWSSGKVLQ